MTDDRITNLIITRIPLDDRKNILHIGDVTIKFLDINNVTGSVKVAVQAPKSISVDRGERRNRQPREAGEKQVRGFLGRNRRK